jgi:exodeoxyribonuclease VII small subunit
MSDETYSFSTAKSRLEDIVAQVRKKDTSLEKSLDLLEEGVRLASACTELIDHAEWTVGTESAEEADATAGGSDEAADASAVDGEPVSDTGGGPAVTEGDSEGDVADEEVDEEGIDDEEGGS